jgi:hypothetical protein
MRHPVTASRKVIISITVIALIIALVGFGAWYTLFRVVPGPYDQPNVSPEEYFKYGSIGTEATAGIPYWIWLVLPRLFPEYLPGSGGYTSLGMVWEEGQEMPIGFAKQTLGIIPQAGLNCALCHVSTYRKSPSEVKLTIVPGGGSQRFDAMAYQRFLFACASDPRFTPDVILNEISYFYEFSGFEKLLYRYLIIPQTRATLLEQKENFAWTNRNPDWGPGRVDLYNPVKFGILEQAVDNTIGASDMMSIWNLKRREGMNLNWDGLNPSLREVVLSSALNEGVTPQSLDLEVMQRLEDELKELSPPEYPFDIDENLALAGKDIFDNECAVCHLPGQERTGQVIPIREIGTDRHRLDMWGEKDAAAYNAGYHDYKWGFKTFQNIDGYVASPLDGLWLRAPYLHNGSMPTLADLLEVPAKRPQVFYRGYDIYDPVKVGFISDVIRNEANGTEFFRYDTTLPGNSNEGHLYGTELSAADKKALIEYLKKQ